jgi:hypothetical protein
MRYLSHCLISSILILFRFFSCKESTEPDDQTANWKTVFYDDFSRESTDDGDIGNNWIVCKTEFDQIIQIKNNEVYAQREIPQIGASETCPYVLYIQEFDHSIMKISINARTDSNPNYPIFMLFAGADSLLDKGYIFGYEREAFHSYDPYGENIAPYEISLSATYTITLTIKNKGYLWEINDSASGVLLHWGGTDDEVLISGRIGFIAGAFSPNAVYIDDFRIEIPK